MSTNGPAKEAFQLEPFVRQEGGPVYSWKPDELEKHIKGVATGALYISCAHDDVLRAAAQEVAFASDFADHVVLSVWAGMDELIDLSAFLTQIERLKADARHNPDGKKVIFVIDVPRSLLPKLAQFAGRFRNLPARSALILFTVRLEWLEGREITNWHGGIDNWPVDALPLLLQACDPEITPDTVRDLVSRCRPLVHRTRTVRDEMELINMVDQCLRDFGIDGVKQALDDGRLGRRVEPAEVTTARDRWRKMSPITQASLFLAVRFPTLSWEAFEYLMPALLDGKTEKITRSVPGIPTKEEPNPPAREEPEHRPALEFWMESPHQHLGDAGLCCVESSSSADLIQFIEPSQEPALREALQSNANISMEMYGALHSRGLYFDPMTPPPIAVELAKATRQLMSRAERTYNEHWLYDRVRNIQDWVTKRKRKEVDSIQVDDLDQLFKSLIRAEENGRNLESLFFNRLCELCSELLSEPKTAPIVERFIQQLMQQATGYQILLFVRRLKGDAAFGHMRWVRHLFNAGDTDTCKGTLQILFSEQAEPRRFWDVCAELASWVSAAGESLKQHERWALSFLPMWFLDHSQRLAALQKKDPQARLDLALFLEISDSESMDTRMTILADWISHPQFAESTWWVRSRLYKQDKVPSTGSSLKEEDEHEEETAEEELNVANYADYLLGDMLERWNEWHGATGGVRPVALLASKLATRLPRLRLIRVREFLRWRANYYFAERGQVEPAERPVIDRLATQARELEKRLYPAAQTPQEKAA